jgi:hypothetical protein
MLLIILYLSYALEIYYLNLTACQLHLPCLYLTVMFAEGYCRFLQETYHEVVKSQQSCHFDILLKGSN